MSPTFGAVLRQARKVREMSSAEAARAAGISAAYLSKLESDDVKTPSPHVLYGLSEALVVPYSDLMLLSGYHVPGPTNPDASATVSAALLASLTDAEREEIVEYLAWQRSRRRMPEASPEDRSRAEAPPVMR